MENSRRPICWMICTLDTKAREAAFLQNELLTLGVDARIADPGIGSESEKADIGSEEIAAAANTALSSLRGARARMDALTVMANGVQKVLLEKFAQGQLDAVIALGGSGGMTLAAPVMQALPVGIPKMMVSSVVSGDVRPFIGGKDVMLLNPVADLAGLNSLTRGALRAAAKAIAGQLLFATNACENAASSVALTSFGSTEGCVSRCVKALEGKGYETTCFHARGVSGGDVMEELIRRGNFCGVMDLTTTEATDLAGNGVYPCASTRFEAAADTCTPFVLAPGAVDMINLSALAATPERCQGRITVRHSANTVLVRANEEESRRAAAFIGEKLRKARGPFKVLLPLKGFSIYDRQGGAFWAPDIDEAFIETLRRTMNRPECVIELPLHMNDEAFAVRAVLELTAMM